MFQEIDIIDFEDKQYKCRVIDLGEEFGEVQVASTVLEKKLLTKKFGYVSQTARYVDEQIFFFISPVHFRLSDRKLAQLILSHVQ